MSAKNVEHVGWLGKIRYLHVAVLMLAIEFIWRRENSWVFVTELKVSLHTSRRMFRTLTIVTVRQAHDQTTTLKPLGLARSDKLVNDTLGVVGEITELSLPDNQGIGRRQAISILETKPVKY